MENGIWNGIKQAEQAFIIAEAGVNHNGDMEMALRMIDAAADAGVDAIKFQTFKAELVATADAPKAAYQHRTTGTEESQLDMLRKLELTHDAHRQLFSYCRDKGIIFMSTPFDFESADFLDQLDVAVYKIPSGEITNLPFLAHVARKRKPLIVSTGMACLGEVETAVNTIEETGNKQLMLLHCVSNYPADPGDVNLRAMQTLKTAFNLPVGLSDHTPGIEVAIAASAMGACVIEKHFTLNRNLPGPDHKASLTTDELAALVRSIRNVASAMGDGRKIPSKTEEEVALVARKSIVAVRSIPAGTILTEDLITFKRPGTGIPPSMLHHVLGKRVNKSIQADELLAMEMLQ